MTYLGAVPPLAGGVAQHGGQLVRALRERGHEVHVESWRSQYPKRLYPGERQWRDDVAMLPGAVHRMRWWDPVSWLLAGRRSRATEGLVVPWVVPAQAPALLAAMGAARRPTVVMVHNPRPHEGFPFADRLTRAVVRRADGVLAHTPGVLEELRALDVGDIPAHVVPHAPNLPVGASPMPPPPLRLLTLGYVRPYKGVDLAVSALAALVSDGVDATLTVAGEAWDGGENLRRLVTDLGVDDRVDLRLAYVPDDEVESLLAAHHVVVLPYRHATQSGVVPLAFAAGRPVVVTGVGGLGEQVRDGHNGRVAVPEDVHDLAAAVQDVASDLDRFGREAEASAPGWGALADAAVELLAAAAVSRGGSSEAVREGRPGGRSR